MGKRGPKRRPGAREPNGQLSRRKQTTMERLNELNRRQQDEVMAVVLAQPHRQGSQDRWLGDAVGRFCRKHGLDAAIYDACQEYASCYRRWLAGKGAPKETGEHAPGSGAGPTAEQMARWDDKIRRVESALRRRFPPFLVNKVFYICVEDVEVPEVPAPDLVCALAEIGVALDFLDRNPHPYGGTA